MCDVLQPTSKQQSNNRKEEKIFLNYLVQKLHSSLLLAKIKNKIHNTIFKRTDEQGLKLLGKGCYGK